MAPCETPPAPTADGGRQALRAIAGFEALKGLAALAGVAGWLALMHHDLHRLALELIGHFDLDPHAHYPALLLQGVDQFNATPFKTVALVGFAYATTRWIEAWGLWHDRPWGAGFGALSGGLYLPFEVRHLWHSPTWPSALVVVCNVALVVWLTRRLTRRLRPGRTDITHLTRGHA